MGIIPIEEKYLPDELFYSWLCRLSEINLLPKSSFINGYCILNEKNDRNRNRPIALDLKREIAGLCGNLHDKPDAMKVSMDTTTFPFEAIVMTEELQSRRVMNMFWPIDKLNTDARSLFTGIKICPECIKNDKVPYIRRAHQLTGVCTCHIHGCKLMAYIGRNGHEMDFDLDNYKEVESNIKMESMQFYARYVYCLLKAEVQTNAHTVTSVLVKTMNEKNQYRDIISGSENLIKDMKQWQYSDLITQDIEKFIMRRRWYSNAPSMKRIMPIIMFFYPNPEDFISVLPKQEPIMKRYQCNKCHQEYVSTPYLERNGWGCPHCNQGIPEKTRFKNLVNIYGKEKYELRTEFENMNKKVKMYHQKCGKERLFVPRDYLFGRSRCVCENVMYQEEVRRNVERYPQFKLLEFIDTNTPMIVLHKKCNRSFPCNYYQFIHSPVCRVCYPKVMTEDLYAQRVKDLVGDEYTIKKGFRTTHEKVILKHNKCGNEQAYIPFNFFRGQRCKYCNERVTRNILENMLSACSEGRYTITDYSKVSCVVLDKRTGNEISIFPRKLRQEIVRPTPSDLFEFFKKITEVDVAMSEWDFFFRLLCEYREEYGNTNVPGRVVYKSHRLGSWVGSQRNAYQNNTLRKDREDLLRSIGFDFEWRETVWLQKFEIYRHYVEITGNPCVSFQTDFEGVHLGIWISEQKKAYRAGTLSEDRRKKLEELGMTF